MKAVISWSGSRELAIAKAVRSGLVDTVPEIQPFISPDLSKGTLWFDELANQLNDAELGFMCLAPPRIASDWQVVEAGAIWKAAGNGRLFPLCFRTPAAVISEPLQAFQSTQFDREDFERLATHIASRIFGRGWTTKDKDAFESAWSRLKAAVEEAFSQPDDSVYTTTRGFIHEVAGKWWERVKSVTGDTELSWMTIEPSADRNGAIIGGTGFDLAGKPASRWDAHFVSVDATKATVEYYWEGPSSKLGLKFGGKGSMSFTIKSNGGIEKAHG